ncbi:MAG: FAD-dependent monooxygenase [Acidimicrobiales bacterium]
MILSDEPLEPSYPVIIIGGGSVGLSLAAELGWRGVECLVLEERPGLNDHPRANAVANRTMEYYRRWGIDQAITDAGIPPDLPAEYLWVTSLHGREIHRVSLPPFDQLLLTRQTGGYADAEFNWSPYLKTITGQNEVEQVILDYIAGQKAVDLRFEWRLLDFVDDGEKVTCRVEHIPSGRIELVEAGYLAGCDGGRSTVRRQLEIAYEGTSSLASFVSVYFHAPEMINRHPFGHGNIFFPLHRDHRGFLLTWDDDQTYTYHLILNEGQDWTDIDPVAAVTGVVGSDFDVTVRSVQPWDAHALVATKYSSGRCFLVGDSAHLFSPTGGFGMNTGVSDAIDLAWKLEAALSGWAGDGLLDSYDIERRPVGHRNTQEAADCFDHLFRVMQNGDELDGEGPESDQVRRDLKADIKDQEKLIASSGTLLGYRYEGSPIVVSDGTPEPPDDARKYLPIARPGHRAPHVWLDSGDALFDRLGPGFTLLRVGDSPPDTSALIEAAATVGVPLTVLDLTEPIVSEVYEAALVLIRPDMMIAWRSDEAPADPAALVDTVRGAADKP